MSLNKKFSPDHLKCTVFFELDRRIAPYAKEVRILGDFNDWKWERGIVMKNNGDSYSAQIELKTGKLYEYRYMIDRLRWENDESADAYHPSPFQGTNNCVIDLINLPKTEGKPTKNRKKKTPDLRMVEGIGPKIKGLLAKEGIETFNDLAKTDINKLRGILVAAGSRYKMHDPTTWPEQAQLAAQGKWDELKVLQNELKGGRR